ncbi:hypothetical protein Tco_1122381 [Tanacetum coccineum]|uniref:Uncharacterized protein n=1 Tax=Tanacetum coccineum TaxID=301880 RepID=A0ABQ5J0C9_9ASTR
MGNAIVKLVKKVKKMEGFMKRRNLVLTDSKEEELEVQVGKSQDYPLTSSLPGLVCSSNNKAGAEQVNAASVNAASVNTASGVNTVSAVDAEKPTSDQDKGQRKEWLDMLHLDSSTSTKEIQRIELNEQQKKRKAQVMFEAQHYTNEDWDLIRAKLEANAELSKSMLGSEAQGEDFAKKMVDLVNQRKKYFAEQRAKAKKKAYDPKHS